MHGIHGHAHHLQELPAGWLQRHAACMLGLRLCYSLMSGKAHLQLAAPCDCRAGSTLRIGPPLDQEQQKVMACICKDAGVRYEFVPDLTTDAKV